LVKPFVSYQISGKLLTPASGRLLPTRSEVPILTKPATKPVVVEVQKQTAREGGLFTFHPHRGPELDRHAGAIGERLSHPHLHLVLGVGD
jgi:hypothetical protein